MVSPWLSRSHGKKAPSIPEKIPPVCSVVHTVFYGFALFVAWCDPLAQLCFSQRISRIFHRIFAMFVFIFGYTAGYDTVTA